jgi:pimeloyl-ACP methyl ester carboxylesterase
MQSQDTFTEVPGGQIFTRIWKDPIAPFKEPVILIHDSLGCSELWRDFPVLLANTLNRPVVTYDRLGFGRSDARKGLPSTRFIEEEAELYFPFLKKALGFDECVLYGHSVGGAMALSIAAQHPEICKAVISESAQAYVQDLTLDGIRKAQLEFKKSDGIARLKKYHGNKSEWVLNAWTQIWLSPEFKLWSLESTLPKVKAPVLAIHGDQDEYGSADFPQYICSRTGGSSTLKIIEQCGHVPHREKPATVRDIVSDFIKDNF